MPKAPNKTAMLRLPKTIEADPRAPLLRHFLKTHNRPLWPGGSEAASGATLNKSMCHALQAAHYAGQVVRSLEKAESRLAGEARGQQMVDRKRGTPRGVRISRLLVITNDGAERFYRQVASLLKRHGQRVIAVRLDASAEELGKLLYGPGRSARLILIEHKAAVGDVLMALVDQWVVSGDK